MIYEYKLSGPFTGHPISFIFIFMEDKLLTFRISEIKQETELAKTDILDSRNPQPVKYLPGQFLTFIINLKDQQVRRSYSISSMPGEPLAVTIQKVDNGLFSRHILRNWKVGDELISLPPMGRFSLEPQSALSRDIFCFAAGSGIIPILPQVRRLLMDEPQSIIHLIYSNSTEKRTLFLEEIAYLNERHNKLEVTLLFSDPVRQLNSRGRLSNLFTRNLVNKQLRHSPADAVFLVCGPFSYMRMLYITLVAMHFPKNNIRRENYIPEIMRSGYVSHPEFPDHKLQIEFNGKHREIMVKSGEDILTAALQNELHIPYSCRGGVCGTCAAMCKKGKVHMSINEVLTDEDIKAGWVLTCTGYPAEDHTVISF